MKDILTEDEAKSNRLCLRTYKEAVDEFINSGAGKRDDSFMVVAFETSSSVPVAMALLKRNAYDPKHLQAIPQHTFRSEMKQTTRKFIWELKYVVRRADQSSKGLGDICVSCAVEEVQKRADNHSHGMSTIIWLIVANGLDNTPALRLYFRYGFNIIGMYVNALMMALCNVNAGSVRRALKEVVAKLESKFLLPVLKERFISQESESQDIPSLSSVHDSQDPGTQGSQDVVSQDSSLAPGSSQHSNAAVGVNDDQSEDGSSVDEVSSQQFSFFAKWRIYHI